MSAIAGLVVAILLSFALETLFDLGVVAALVCALIGIVVLPRRPHLLGFALAIVMPLAGWFFIDGEWSRTTPLLYGAFTLVAVAAGFTTGRRESFVAAGVGAVIAGVLLVGA